jgi:hypothetical protein
MIRPEIPQLTPTSDIYWRIASLGGVHRFEGTEWLTDVYVAPCTTLQPTQFDVTFKDIDLARQQRVKVNIRQSYFMQVGTVWRDGRCVGQLPVAKTTRLRIIPEDSKFTVSKLLYLQG